MSTDEQVSNVFTKPLSQVKFEYFRDKLGVVQKNFLSRRNNDDTTNDEDMESLWKGGTSRRYALPS